MESATGKRSAALRRIKACLRLAASPNPHEAAAALRQARKLMDEHGLTESDAVASDVGNADAPTGMRGGRPPASFLWLANVVAGGFRCHSVLIRYPAAGTTIVRFFGRDSDSEIAAYALIVLNRQLTADRRKHTKRVRKRAVKAQRGESFALGWVSAIEELFPAEKLADEHLAAIDTAIRSRVGVLQSSEQKAGGKSRHRSSDIGAGWAAGKQAKLHRGVKGRAGRALSLERRP